jgi:hypothetical protein
MEKTKEQKRKEREVIAAYYDTRMRELLDPLYENFKKWKKRELSHDELCERIHEFHKENQKVHSLFCQNRAFLLRLIEWEKQNEVRNSGKNNERSN